MRWTADCVFKNGQVVTMDSAGQVAQALAVAGDRILRVGTHEAMDELVGSGTRVFDLKGRSLLPGFIDSHVHMDMGLMELGVNLRYPGVRSLADIQQRIVQAVRAAPPGQWIRGWGYDQNRLAERRHPTRRELDAWAPDHPVMLIRTCEHISVHNSRSLAAAEVREDEPDPPGGEIGRRGGHLNGLMKETAHVRMMRSAPFTEAESYRALLLSDRELCRLGIASAHDAGVGRHQMPLFQRAACNGDLQVRVYAMIFSDLMGYSRDFMKSRIPTGFGNERLKIGPIKAMLDGSSSGPSAATREPYASDPDNRGILYWPQEEVDAFVAEAHNLGYQVTAHAVGDRAVEMMVNAIEKALAARPRADHRHRIEHCAMVDDRLLDRIATLGIVPVVQPVFLYEFGDGYRVHYGKTRADRMFSVKSFLDRGVRPAAGSDAAVTFPDPLLGIHMAVNRVTQSGQPMSQKERVGILDALRLYTVHGAYASFEENIKGSLEPGKLADLAVLSASILDCPSEAIKNLKVDATVIGGQFVYESHDAPVRSEAV